MCDQCGCAGSGTKVVEVNQSLLAANQEIAEKKGCFTPEPETLSDGAVSYHG